MPVPHGFAVAVVLEDGSLEWADGGQPLTRGDVLAVPDGLGDWAVPTPAAWSSADPARPGRRCA